MKVNMEGRPPRPDGYPVLEDYEPSPYMLPTSHYDEARADRAVMFFELLKHTKGEWMGKPFWLMPWQEQIVRDVFGIVKEDGYRQFKTIYVEIPKKNGKSELAAGFALYLLYMDREGAPEVFSAASDREQAGIVFDVASKMVEYSSALMRMSKIISNTKRIVCYQNNGKYQVVSAEVGNKHGFSISGLVFDEIHTQRNRDLWDVLTVGSGDARRQPLHVAITTAGNNRNSICYELHTKAVELLEHKREDPTFYPVVYSLPMEEDWTDPANWAKVNPSLGITVPMEKVKEAYLNAVGNPAEEATFRQLRLCQWTGSAIAWIPDAIIKKGADPIDVDALEGKECYAALDLSSSGDITACVLVFPPEERDGRFVVLPRFWVPEDTVEERVRRTGFPYDNWIAKGYVAVTPGNVIDYAYIKEDLRKLSGKYRIKEVAYDPWHAMMLIQELDEMLDGTTMVEFRQGYASMSPASKQFYEDMMRGRIQHGGNPVFVWMLGNVVVTQDPAGNIKPDKHKSSEKIDGVVAAIMAHARATLQADYSSVYDTRGLLTI